MEIIGDLLSNFGVNWTSFLFQLVTFALLLVLLRMIVYKPMLSMLEERKQRIAQGIKDAEAAAEAKAKSEHEAAERLKEATNRAEALLEETQKSSKILKDQLMAQTQAEIDRVKSAHEEQLAKMKQDMLREVKADVASLVVTTTTKVLGEHLSSADQQKIADKAAKELK